jgi:cyclic dehypoxanthinyl futalosine synthase
MTLSREQALDCFASDDLIGIGMEADAVRRSLHPEGVVSYAIDGVVDVRDPSAVFAQVEQILEVGGT